MDINKLIDDHRKTVDEIEKLEEKSHNLGEQILKATEGMTREQLLEIYPKIKDSTVKFELFMKLKKNYAKID